MKGPPNEKADAQDAIDRAMIAQTDDESAWEEPMHVRRGKQESVVLPAELAARAAFFARLHREASVQDWLRRIIEERTDLEEAAFASLKREMAGKHSS